MAYENRAGNRITNEVFNKLTPKLKAKYQRVETPVKAPKNTVTSKDAEVATPTPKIEKSEEKSSKK